MRKRPFALLLAAAVVSTVPLAAATAGDEVYVAAGVPVAAFDGALAANGARDYRLPARHGQTLAVSLSSKSGLVHFRILSPGDGHALYDSRKHGDNVSGVALPDDGTYTIRVLTGDEPGPATRHYTVQMTLS